MLLHAPCVSHPMFVQAVFSTEQQEALLKFWRIHKPKVFSAYSCFFMIHCSSFTRAFVLPSFHAQIHAFLVRSVSWNNSLAKFSWRIDSKTKSRASSTGANNNAAPTETGELTAIIEMTIAPPASSSSASSSSSSSSATQAGATQAQAKEPQKEVQRVILPRCVALPLSVLSPLPSSSLVVMVSPLFVPLLFVLFVLDYAIRFVILFLVSFLPLTRLSHNYQVVRFELDQAGLARILREVNTIQKQIQRHASAS